MELKIIKTKKQYQQYLDWVNELFDKKVKPHTPEGEKLQVALLLIKQYEDAHYPVPDSRHQVKMVEKVGNKGYIGFNPTATVFKFKNIIIETRRKAIRTQAIQRHFTCNS